MSLLWLGLALLTGQDRRQLLGELETFDTQISAATQELAQLEARGATLETERVGHTKGLVESEAELSVRRDDARARLQGLYKLKRHGVARLLFDAESPSEFRRRVRYLLALVRVDEARTEAFRRAGEEHKVASARVDTDVAALAALRTEVTTRMSSLASQRARRAALLNDMRTQPALAARALEERGAAADALQDSFVEPKAQPLPSDAAAFRAERGRLPSPVNGVIVRAFGPYTDDATGLLAASQGVDIRAPLGAPFRAIADGVVTRSGYLRGYGQMVMLEHGPYTTLYTHANGLRVAQGQSVQRGEVLGHVGNTGLPENADAQLHFELRYNNTPQDPAEWIAGLR